jgi:hypothetical protein
LSDTVHELSELAQVVAAVGVRENDDVAAGSLETTTDRHAVPPPGFRDDGRAFGGRRDRAAVRGTVVNDDDLTAKPGCA